MTSYSPLPKIGRSIPDILIVFSTDIQLDHSRMKLQFQLTDYFMAIHHSTKEKHQKKSPNNKVFDFVYTV